MKSTTISLATIAVLCVGAAPLSRAADEPFIGKWKLNLSKSKLADQMTIAPAGANRYTLTFAGVGDTETLVADGTDQPGILGSTISITVEAPGNWKIVRKQAGRTLLTANWKLSDDGKALTDTFIGNQPDGSTSRVDLVYKRAESSAGNSGIPGTWETTQEKPDSAYEMEIRPYEGDGLSFIISGRRASEQREVRWKGISAGGRQSRCRPRHIRAPPRRSLHRVNQKTQRQDCGNS